MDFQDTKLDYTSASILLSCSHNRSNQNAFKPLNSSSKHRVKRLQLFKAVKSGTGHVRALYWLLLFTIIGIDLCIGKDLLISAVLQLPAQTASTPITGGLHRYKRMLNSLKWNKTHAEILSDRRHDRRICKLMLNFIFKCCIKMTGMWRTGTSIRKPNIFGVWFPNQTHIIFLWYQKHISFYGKKADISLH